MKKKLIIALSLVAVLALGLTGCGKKDSAVPPAASEQVTPSSPEDSGSANTDAAPFESLIAMLGKSDADVKDLFDGGTENTPPDSDTVLGRTYEATLEGYPALVETVYDDSQSVSAVSVFFTGASTDEVKTLLEQAFGEASTVDNTDNMDSKYAVWTLEKAEITLNVSYDQPAVQITQLAQ